MAKKQMAKEAEEADKVDQPVDAPAEQPKPEGEAVKTGNRNGGAEVADFEKTAGDMKAMLDAQPKVRVLVPLESGEKLGEFLPLNINGYRLNVPKGVYVEVPLTAADIIADAYNSYEINSAAAMRVDRNDDVQSALN